MNWANLNVLITGGTGSFGREFVKIMLTEYHPQKLIIFSRDELKQYEMSQKFNESEYPNLRYFLGDIRDKERLDRAFHGVDIVIHAAALKHVPAGEYNPFEVIKTNVIGAQNIINAAIDQGVKKVIALSSDKAVNPINLYGASKLCADKLFVAANSYSGLANTRFSVVRYGNVVGSRGSVIPYFLKIRNNGQLPITDPRMTRFWITLPQGVKFVIKCLSLMKGGEIFIPKIPSMKIVDLASAIAPHAKLKIIGIRPGEKLHEVMITIDDARNCLEFDNYYIIQPIFPWWDGSWYKNNGGRPVAEDFSYTSNNNSWWLTSEELKEMINTLEIE